MGIDFEIVAYRGEPVSVERLAELIARYTPYAELFRHAIAADVKSPVARDLHMIAFYDDQRGDSDAALAAARESAANGGSLSDVVKQAWSLARAAVHEKLPEPARAIEAQETSCARRTNAAS